MFQNAFLFAMVMTFGIITTILLVKLIGRDVEIFLREGYGPQDILNHPYARKLRWMGRFIYLSLFVALAGFVGFVVSLF